MLTVELKFKEGEREMSFDRLADAFALKIAVALREHLLKDTPIQRDEEQLITKNGTTPQPPKAVNITDAAMLLCISPVTLRLYATEGRIRVTHIGRRVVVPMESIEKVLREGVASRRQ